jgi:hypothetical protein
MRGRIASAAVGAHIAKKSASSRGSKGSSRSERNRRFKSRATKTDRSVKTTTT